ncbi:DevR family CRISPR-associated autoregulator [Paenibacillus cisolokensis]|uniref:DevR family CRISPR-associated autoregulator n=1 Tax=Paenibacillus cisolokensis TaxID=1658519 RepID=UPI003D297B75
MTLHIHGTVVTHYGVAANNRGETEGNLTTLQKLLWKGETHSSVSAEAIRFAIRAYFQEQYELTGDERFLTNRYWVATPEGGDHAWRNQSFSEADYLDDDLFGYMDAKAPASELHSDEETTDGQSAKKTKPKGKARARRGAMEISRAISLDPFIGETTFNARGGQKNNTSLYATEIHATSYQFSFSLTPSYLAVPERSKLVLNAIASLNAVGGNQSRYLFDFSPSSVLLRLTDDPAPRILFIFEGASDSPDKLAKLLHTVEAGDLDGKELILGGEAAGWEQAQALRKYGVAVFPGVKEAFQQAQGRLLS